MFSIRILCIALLTTHVLATADTVLKPSYMSFAQVADRYIKDTPVKKSGPGGDGSQAIALTSGTGNTEDNKKTELKRLRERQIALLEKKLDTTEQQKVTFGILGHVAAASKGGSYSPLETLAHDLNFFVYQSKKIEDKDKHLFSRINRTSTIFGEAFLAHQLANPTSDINELTRRQNIVKELVQNEQLFNKLDTLMQQVKDQQEDILTNYAPTDPALQALINAEFWHGTNWFSKLFMGANTRPYVNEFIAKYPYIGGASVVAKAAHAVYKVAQGRERELSPVDYIAGGLTIGIVQQIPAQLIIRWLLREDLRMQAEIQKKTHERMFKTTIGLKTLMKNTYYMARELAKCTDNDAARSLLAQARQPVTDPTVNQLQALLKDEMFAATGYERSFWNLNHGYLRAAYWNAQECKAGLTHHLKMIGELDALLSTAKLYKEHQGRDARYSFVNFTQEKAPHVQAREFWNPMISADQAITNSLDLGGQASQGAIVTGSNTGGKSTVATVGLTSMLAIAQALTIAPAAELSMRPFDYIGTVMKVEDNVVSGDSHYQAELKNAINVQRALKKLPAGKTAFLGIDEAFQGTDPKVGSHALCNFIRTIVKNKRVLFSAVTHYKEATELEKTTDGACKNYKVDVSVDENGEIHRPHKLEPGVSQVNIADKLYKDMQHHHNVFADLSD